MLPDNNFFLSKLDELSGGRNKTPWLQDVGLTKGTISRLINGDPPSLDVLTALSRTENASLNWLAEGRGRPYLVARAVNDADAWLIVDELLQEHGWTLYRFSDPAGNNCLVLTQPGEFEIKGRSVAYTLVEIVAGDVGQRTMARAGEAETEGMTLLSAEISDDEFDRLSTGRMGNYELLGWRNEHGLIHTAVPDTRAHLSGVAEARVNYNDALTPAERRLLHLFRRLESRDQSRLTKLAESFLAE